MHLRVPAVSLLALAAHLFVASLGHASVYSSLAQVGGTGLGDNGSGPPSLRIAMADSGDGLLSGFAAASSDAGYISGFASVSASDVVNFPPAANVNARAAGFLQIDDVLITRTDNTLPGMVDATLQISFDGPSDLNNLTNLSGGLNATDDFSLLDLGNGLLTTTKSVPVDQPVTIFLGAEVRVELDGMPGEAEAGFTAFLGGSPVFLLPDGYVANSIDGQIVNNFYVGPVVSVPEPATALFLAVPLATLLMRRSR